MMLYTEKEFLLGEIPKEEYITRDKDVEFIKNKKIYSEIEYLRYIKERSSR